MKHTKRPNVEIYHDGKQGYYYNFDTKLIYFKNFDTLNYQKKYKENFKKYSGVTNCLVFILIPITNWYRAVANSQLNIIFAILFIVIAIVVNSKSNNIIFKQKEKINNLRFEKIENDKGKINDIIIASENLTNNLLMLLIITSLSPLILIVMYFKYSILIFFPIAIMSLLISKLLIENIDFLGRKVALKEIKKLYKY